MNSLVQKGARFGVLILVSMALVGCGLPRSGPGKKEIYKSSVQSEGDAHIVEVDNWVVRSTKSEPPLGFSQALLNAGSIGSDTIRPGDVLGLAVWENVDDGLLSSGAGGATSLDELQVDGDGFIFVPYAGRIKAAGNTPESLRRVITGKLDSQTPDPQVQVSRLAGDGATVSIIGGVGAQGVFPIERPTRRLSAMLAQAGGVTVEPEVAQVTVIRGPHSDTIWFQDLFRHPQLDIALRGNDRILVEADTRAYTVMGATGAQSRVTFETQELSAIEALAQSGGLNSSLADPKGVFVFRDEPASIANTVLNREDLQGRQRFAYVIDLTKPSGIFVARDFQIRDGDTIYVTEAPFVVWNKTISAITGSLTTLTATSSLADR